MLKLLQWQPHCHYFLKSLNPNRTKKIPGVRPPHWTKWPLWKLHQSLQTALQNLIISSVWLLSYFCFLLYFCPHVRPPPTNSAPPPNAPSIITALLHKSPLSAAWKTLRASAGCKGNNNNNERLACLGVHSLTCQVIRPGSGSGRRPAVG